MMKKLAAIAAFLCGVSIAFSVSADEFNHTVTNNSGLSSMHGVSGEFEEYSEENVEILPAGTGNQTVQAIRLTASDMRKLYRQKPYIGTNRTEDGLYLRIGHFSIYLIQKL
ncbi:MAG: hypothetical protein ACI33P_02440 [Lysinibacillus sp.]